MSLKIVVAKNINALLESQKWSITELSKRSGVNPATISSLQKNQPVNLTLDTIEKLAGAFGVSSVGLMSDEVTLRAAPPPPPVEPSLKEALEVVSHHLEAFNEMYEKIEPLEKRLFKVEDELWPIPFDDD